MLNNNDLKNYIIFDNTKKYDEINEKVMKLTKTYFKTMKNHSFQISQIENKLNEYNIKNKIQIKKLLQNQQNLIKELIVIINQMLSYKSTNDTNSFKSKNISENSSSLNKKNKNTCNKTIKNLKTNAPNNNSISKSSRQEKLNIKEYIKKADIYVNNNYIERNKKAGINKNNSSNNPKDKIPSLNISSLKSLNDIKFNPNSINIKYLNKNNKNLDKAFFKKLQIKDNSDVTNKKLYNSISVSDIQNNQKSNNRPIYLKTSSYDNTCATNLKNNYTIDEERNNISYNYENDRQTSGNNRKNNYGSLPNLLFQQKNLKKVKYRSVKTVPLKEEYYLINNYTFTNFNITNNSSSLQSIDKSYNRSNSSLILYNSNLINFLGKNLSLKHIKNNLYSIPYGSNRIHIIPSRFTKEFLSGSYKIVNKYKSKKI